MSEATLDADVAPSAGVGADAVLRAEGVGKRFGAVAAVDGVDLQLWPGEILSLVGPSGCGKSTLLRLLAGLQRVDRGAVAVRGEPVDGPDAWVPAERRNVGVVFQDHALFPHLSVGDNIAFGLVERDRRRRRHDADARAGRLREVLSLVDLDGLVDRYPHELSGGEQQRVALARALAPDPDVILLDEPFSDLDRSLRGRVRDETVRVLRAAGTAALLVTHDQEEALATGERLAVMRAGRLEQTDVPAAVFHAPRNRFVATFMGEADFLPATVGAGGTIHTEVGEVAGSNAATAALHERPGSDAATAALHERPGSDAATAALHERPGSDAAAGGDLEVMLRPHEVAFEPDPAGDAVITDLEFQGAFVLHTLSLASGRQLRSLRPHTVDAVVGTRVRPRLDPGHAPTVMRGDEAVAGPQPRPGAPGAERRRP